MLYRQDQILVYGEQFDETFEFDSFYKKNYDNLFQKYNTYTVEEEDELRKKMGYGEGSDDIFSLRFHLEKRKTMEAEGICLPFYINQEKMPF